jgi:type III pantothenate kinase
VSVDPSFASGFKRIAGARERDVVVWNADHPLPISHPYAQAEKLGVDRLLGALAAHHLHPQVDVIVVDAGTAVTVDVVCADGTFAGGAIAPGLLSLSESLARSGRQLPRVDPLQRADYPGVSTDACLSVGIRAAFDGALTQLVSAALESVPNAVIVVTGGDGAAAAEALQDHDVEQVPALIHIGFHELESHLAAEE